MRMKMRKSVWLLAMLLASVNAVAASHWVTVKSSQTSNLGVSTSQDGTGQNSVNVGVGTDVFILLKNKSGVNEIGSVRAILTVSADIAQGRTRAADIPTLGFYEDVAVTAVDEGFVYKLTMPDHESDLGTGYSIEVSAEVKTKNSLADATITLSPDVFTYNGLAQKPTVTVKYGDKVLSELTDYTIGWPDDVINVGSSKTVTINPASNSHYTGSNQGTYTIKAVEIKSKESAEIALTQKQFTFDGKDNKKYTDVTVKLDGFAQALTADDYEVVWYKHDGTGYQKMEQQPKYDEDNPGYGFDGSAAKYQALISSKNSNYTFQDIARNFEIAGKPLQKAWVTPSTLTNLTWNDTEQAAPVSNLAVKDDQLGELKKGEDYTISYKKKSGSSFVAYEGSTFKDLGEYMVVITGIGNYTGTEEKTFNVEGQTLNDITLSETVVEFDNSVDGGKDQTPTITVKDAGGNTLTVNTHYTVTWYQITSAEGQPETTELSTERKLPGNYLVVITAKEGTGFTGSDKEYFTIKERNLEDKTLDNVTDLVALYLGETKQASVYYDGQEYAPTVKVTLNGKELKLNEDYELEWESQDGNLEKGTYQNVGAYKVTVTGKGNYQGTRERVFNIDRRLISDPNITITRPEPVVYNGAKQAPTITLTLKCNDGTTNYTLVENTDYQLTWDDDSFIDQKAYKATIRGLNNFADGDVSFDKTVTYTISAKALEDSWVSLSANNVPYNGSRQEPTITVSFTEDGQTKTLSATGDKPDYKVEWANNAYDFTAPGTYQYKVIGLNNYSGTLQKGYTIEGKILKPEDVDVDVLGKNQTRMDNAEYTGGKIKLPSITITTKSTSAPSSYQLQSEKDYTIEWSYDKDANWKEADGAENVGTYTATITGVGNYAGTTIPVTFSITTKSIEDAMVKMYISDDEKDVVQSGTSYTPVIKLMYNEKEVDAAQYTLTWEKKNGDSWETVSGANPSFSEMGVYRATVEATEGGNFTPGIKGVHSLNIFDDISGEVLKGNLATFSLNGEDLTEDEVIYNGQSQEPTVVIKYNGKDLEENKDYKITWNTTDFTNVGDKVLTFEGMGTYKGTRTRTFKIKPKALVFNMVTLSADEATYTGSAIPRPTVTVKDGSDLALNKDYVVTWPDDFTSAGNKIIKVTGKGNYDNPTVTVDMAFEIKPAAIDDSWLNLNTTSATYDPASTVTPTLTVGKVVDGVSYAPEASDYTLSWDKDDDQAEGTFKNAGAYTATVTGNGNYTGNGTITLNILPKTLVGDWITLTPASADYTGAEISEKPTFTVKDGDHPLTSEGDKPDFTYSWQEGEYKDAGSYKLTLTGQNNYQSEATATFTIAKKKITRADISIKTEADENKQVEENTTGEVYYRKGYTYEPKVTVTVDDKPLTLGEDYTLTWSSTTKALTEDELKGKFTVVGVYNAEIVGINNYMEPHDLPFQIVSRPLSGEVQLELALQAGESAEPENYTTPVPYTGSSYIPVLTVKDLLGTELTPDEDYTVTWTRDNETEPTNDFKNTGLYTATIKGKGNYDPAVPLDKKFEIVGQELDAARWFDIYLNEELYTTPITYDSSKSYTASLKLKEGAPMTEADFTIGDEWTGKTFTEAGTYEITVAGKGNFKDEKVCSFTIKAKSMEADDVTVEIDKSSDDYDGQEKKPVITVKDGGKDLTEDSDYTLTWYVIQEDKTEKQMGEKDKFLDVNSYVVVVEGMKNYEGNRSKTYAINPLEILPAWISISLNGETSTTYTGQKVAPTVTVKHGETDLIQGTHYEITGWSGNLTDAGTYTVNVKGLGNYLTKDDVVSASTFTIRKKVLEEVSVTLDAPQVGSALATTAESTTTGVSAEEGAISVVWSPDDTHAKAGQIYTATVTVKPDGNSEFDTHTNAKINDVKSLATVNADGTLTIEYTFKDVYPLVFSGNNQWMTFYAEDEVTLADGLTAYIVTSLGKESVTVEACEGKTIPKGLPVLIKRDDTSVANYGCCITKTNAAFSGTCAEAYKGVSEATPILSGNYILYNDSFVETAQGILPANHCYLAVEGAAGSRIMTIADESEGTTGLHSFALDAVDGSEGDWYTLFGIRVMKPYRKGVYILNGHKVVIK